MKRKIKVTRKQYERIVLAYRIGGFVAIVGLLIGFAFLIGKPIEFALVFLPYFMTKGLYERQYHAPKLKLCFVFSVGIFAFATLITVPIEYSICASLFIGIAIAFITCKLGGVQVKLQAYAELTKPKPFNVDTCTEAELLERCRELRFSQENTELAVEFFIKKTKYRELADRLCITEHGVAERKQRLKHKLSNKN